MRLRAEFPAQTSAESRRSDTLPFQMARRLSSVLLQCGVLHMSHAVGAQSHGSGWIDS